MAIQMDQSVKDGNTQVSGQLMQMLTGFWVSQSLCVAAELGVADQLAHGPQSTYVLAQVLNAHEDNLYRLLRALASLGIFRELENRVFELTALADLLRSDVPNSMRSVALMLGRENYTAWGKAYQAVRYGESSFESAYGMPIYEYFTKQPESAGLFNDAMTALVSNDNASIMEAYDFGQFSTLVDVGGGHGMLLSSILKRYPHLNGVLFDLEQVVANAGPVLQKAGVESRCRTETGNFFDAVPVGGDGYILSRVAHGFNDEQSVLIMKSIHQQLPKSGKFLMMEFLLESGNSPETARTKLMDVNMMVFSSGGRDRTQEEYEVLLEQADFRLNQVIQTESGIAILEAVKR